MDTAQCCKNFPAKKQHPADLVAIVLRKDNESAQKSRCCGATGGDRRPRASAQGRCRGRAVARRISGSPGRVAVCARSALATGFTIAVALTSACSPLTLHTHEISSPDARYLTEIRKFGRAEATTVIINSSWCEQVGRACDFFRTQAYSNLPLAHQILPPSFYTERQRARADCWAARNAPPATVAAAVDFLRTYSADSGIPIYGDPRSRAESIQDCAERAGNWIT